MNHAIGGVHCQCGIFGGGIGVRIGFRCVDFVGDIHCHRTRINPTLAISHCVSEGSWAIVCFVGLEGDRAIWIQLDCASAVFKCNLITWLDRFAINFSDGQWIAISIFVISQYIDGDRGVFFSGGCIVCHNRRVIDWCDFNIDIGCHQRRAITDGVVEGCRTVVVGFRREDNGAIGL